MSTTTAYGGKGDIFRRLRLRHEIAAVSDRYADRAIELAEQMQNEKKKPTPTQVRGLENVAYSTDKVSDIFDLVKKQTGRERWSLELGESLLAELGECQRDARHIAGAVDPEDSDLPRRVHLLLCREFIKHLSAHFIFLSKRSGDEE